MTHLLLVFVFVSILNQVISNVNVQNIGDSGNDKCNIQCPPGNGEMACGFDAKTVKYQLFSDKCSMNAYGDCHGIAFIETAVHFCIRNQIHQNKRRMYGESCPVFCPSHYRPICAANKLRSYSYRTFNNGCYLDMINCRGEEDNGYVEVSLDFCQRHLMKNIYKENVIVSQFDEYRDYHD